MQRQVGGQEPHWQLPRRFSQLRMPRKPAARIRVKINQLAGVNLLHPPIPIRRPTWKISRETSQAREKV